MPRLKELGVLFSLFIILLLGVSELKIAHVYASSVGETVDRLTGRLVLGFIILNWLILSLVLYYILKSKKNYKIGFFKALEIVGYSAAPIAGYNLLVISLKKKLAQLYIPVDPLGVAASVFLNNFSAEFMAVHIFLWGSVLLVFGNGLKMTLPEFKIKAGISTQINISQVLHK